MNKNYAFLISLVLHILVLKFLSFSPEKTSTSENKRFLSVSTISTFKNGAKADRVSLGRSGILKYPIKNTIKTEEKSSSNMENVFVNSPQMAGQLKAQIAVQYPIRARKEGIEGDVVVLCDISKDGQVKNIKVDVEKSTHQEVLINEIKRAVMATTFSEVKNDTTIELAFNFKLND